MAVVLQNVPIGDQEHTNVLIQRNFHQVEYHLNRIEAQSVTLTDLAEVEARLAPLDPIPVVFLLMS